MFYFRTNFLFQTEDQVHVQITLQMSDIYPVRLGVEPLPGHPFTGLVVMGCPI